AMTILVLSLEVACVISFLAMPSVILMVDRFFLVVTLGATVVLPSPSREADPAAPESLRTGPVKPVAESSQYLPPPASPDRPLAWPVRGVLYARFGKRAESVHDGIDLSAPEGTPIRAAADGRVLFSAPQHGYGNLIIIEHQDGLLTLYAHNRENLVKEGERVRLGQVIARVGRGSATSGPYLHFEVRVGGQPTDPLPYLPPPR
ncbi:MAG: peptidoglycan DD-metalloendopeptidase family protein, partial [Myxococcaceae bacterium]|nr:peptidoglycan DD-metalloendopeptidase family protein [Myxococcaceae bacterium]